MSQFSLLPVVSEFDGQPMTLSTDVASYFGKRHDHVMRDIDLIVARCPGDQLPNFEELILSVQVGKGASKPIRAYRMTKDGFAFLAMGFTGEKAAEWKWNYIAAFNAMEKALVSGKASDAFNAGRLEALSHIVGNRAALAEQAHLLHEEGLTYAQIAGLLQLSSRYVVYRLRKRFAFLNQKEEQR